MNVLALAVKPVSSECSMRCRYCLFADGAGGRAVRNRGGMRPETLEALVEKALADAKGAEEGCSLAFTGGEPTLAGLDFYKKLIEFEDKHNARGIPVSHAIVTNGLAVDRDWAEFFAKHNFAVSVSVDADKKTHDVLRPDASGKDTHNRAVLAARLLAERGVEHNVLSVLTRAIASHPDSAYRYFKDRHIRHMHFVPFLAPFPANAPGQAAGQAGGLEGFALDEEVYGKFLCRFFDLWYRDFTGGDYLSVRDFDRYVHLLAGHPPEDESALGTSLVVEADGSVYPCELRTDDADAMGNVMTDSFAAMLESPAAKAFLAETSDPSTRADLGADTRFLYEGNPAGVDPVLGARLPFKELAGAYKQFFDHARSRLLFLAKRLFAEA